MATFTKLYLADVTPIYTPPTIRGAWDDTAGAVTKSLNSEKDFGGATTTVARAETNVSGTWDVLLYRGISGPLAAQTISGTINLIVGVDVDNAAADMCWHVHAYVTSGDTDTPRGTILTDYVEAVANEWPATPAGRAFASAQSLTSLAISAGDRIVVELGYIARNTVTTSRTGTINYGTLSSSGSILSDLAVAGDPTLGAGFIEFSSAITVGTLTSRVSQDVIEVLSLPVPDARVSQYVVEVLSATTTVPGRISQYVVEVLSQNLTVTSAEQTQFLIVMP
jgi:hypothetical protein